jgi:Bacterial Ig domain
MKCRLQFSRMSGVLLGIITLMVCNFDQEARASTLWIGPNTNFTQSASNLVDELVPGAVSLTRAYSQWLYNPDAGDQGPGAGTPTDTEWAFGTLDNYNSYYYQPFDSYRDGDLSALLVSNAMVVNLVNEDVYLSLTFTQWPQHGGFFAYTRSTPAVSITAPTNGTVLAAPAKVKISAVAALASGTVTNVEFFENQTSLGSQRVAPYGVTLSNLVAGQYALTAVETAAGNSITSLVVNVSVVTPVAVTLLSPQISSNQFTFNYTADPGLNYLIQNSTNLIKWYSLATNVATGNPMQFTDSFSSNGTIYYRVSRLPNP